MDLCQICQEFTTSLSKYLHDGTDSKPMADFHPLEELAERSKHCRLCHMIDYYAVKAFGDPTRSFYNYTRVNVGFERSYSADMRSPLAQLVMAWHPFGPNLRAAIWASPGSPAAASGLISCNPPLPTDSCPEAFSLFRAWFDNCRQDHEDCKRALDGTLIDEDLGPQLPTRVLDLGEPGATDAVLRESKGLRGNYCALSYCWGPPGTQTLTTTRQNLRERLSGIPFDSMPKTYQDAVQVTRQISVRYLWIDALCIIQGDAGDWTHESKQMGSIYQGACLVIAASGATSTRDGCFMSAPRDLRPIDLPFFTSTGQVNDSFNICVLSWEHNTPNFGPLGTRGWALQESYLARRRLHFMPGGPSWVCNTNLRVTERGTLMDPEEYPGWESLMNRYSYTNLTKHTDRLIALEGIATELQKKTKNTYNHGVFLSRISSHLLWMSKHIAPESEDLPGVPTWSWASKGGRKTFWGDMVDLETNIDQNKVRIDNEGCLVLEGEMVECKAYDTAFVTTIDPDDMKSQLLFATFTQFSDFPEYAVLMEAADPQCWGIAIFDRPRFETVHCLCLMSTSFKEFPEQSPWWWAQDAFAKARESLNTHERVFFVLLVVPSADRKECYQRVGVGILLDSSHNESFMKTVQII